MDLVNTGIIKVPNMPYQIINLDTLKVSEMSHSMLVDKPFKWSAYFACIHVCNKESLIVDIESFTLPSRQLLTSLEQSMYSFKMRQVQDFAIAINSTNFTASWLFCPTNSKLEFNRLTQIFLKKLEESVNTSDTG